MLTAIYLDNQLRFITNEINNVRSYRRLPAEPVSDNLPAIDRMPETALGIRHV